MGYAGAPYLALAVDKGTVPELTPSLLQVWIDLCASFLDLSTYKPQVADMRTAVEGLTERVANLNLCAKL